MLMGEVRAEGLWRAIDPVVREGLSEGQEEAIRTAARQDAWQKHPVDIRPALSLPFGRFYIALVAGHESRSTIRSAIERSRHPLAGAANLVVIGTLAAILALAGFGLYELL